MSFFHHFDSSGEAKEEFPRITTDITEQQFKKRKNGLKILLIHLPIREWSYPNIFPIGHGYVASVAMMDGHSVSVLDLNAERRVPVDSADAIVELIEKRVPEMIRELTPDLIGFGGIITQYALIKHTIRLCKSLSPKTPVVLGGGIGSSMPEFMLRFIGADIIVQEEGEATFSELLFRLENETSLHGLQGTVFKRGDQVHNNGLRPSIKSGTQGLDRLPWPARSLYAIEEVYSLNPVGHLNWENKWSDGRASSTKKSLSLLGSRGCPYAKSACDYCYASYLGETYRLRSPSDVADEMFYLRERYGAEYQHFLDDLFLTNWRWVLQFCDELEKRVVSSGKLIEWGSTCRTNIVADDVVRAKKTGRKNFVERAKEVGLRHIGFGVESASPTVLKMIDKSGQTIEKMEIAITEVQNILGYADCSFMIGSPGETVDSVRETVEFCKSVDLRPEVFFYTTAYPGTEFWGLAEEKGLISKAVTGKIGPSDDQIVEKYMLMLGEQGSHVRTNFSELPDEEVLQLAKWATGELNPTETKFKTEPHSGDRQPLSLSANRASV